MWRWIGRVDPQDLQVQRPTFRGRVFVAPRAFGRRCGLVCGFNHDMQDNLSIEFAADCRIDFGWVRFRVPREYHIDL